MKNNFKVGDLVKRVSLLNTPISLHGMLDVGDYGVVVDVKGMHTYIKVSNGDVSVTWDDIRDFELSFLQHEYSGWTQRRKQQNYPWYDITPPSFLQYIEEQTSTKENLEKSLEDTVKLHEDKLREEVKQHRDAIEKDTGGAYQFFLKNEADIIYKLKMSNRPVSKSELIKYHKSIFPKLDEKLFGRLLMRKGYIFSTPRYRQGQPFGLVESILLIGILIYLSFVFVVKFVN